MKAGATAFSEECGRDYWRRQGVADDPEHSTEKLIVALGNLEQGKGNVTGQDLQAVMDRIRIELAARAAGLA
jgi:hypothetical protein